MAAGRSLGAVTDAYAIIEGVVVAPLVGALPRLSPMSDAYPALLHDVHASPVAADLVLLRRFVQPMAWRGRNAAVEKPWTHPADRVVDGRYSAVRRTTAASPPPTTVPTGHITARRASATSGFDGGHGFPRFYPMVLAATIAKRTTRGVPSASGQPRPRKIFLPGRARAHNQCLRRGVAGPRASSASRRTRSSSSTAARGMRGRSGGRRRSGVFCNLELHDKNEIDHNAVVFDDAYTFEPCT